MTSNVYSCWRGHHRGHLGDTTLVFPLSSMICNCKFPCMTASTCSNLSNARPTPCNDVKSFPEPRGRGLLPLSSLCRTTGRMSRSEGYRGADVSGTTFSGALQGMISNRTPSTQIDKHCLSVMYDNRKDSLPNHTSVVCPYRQLLADIASFSEIHYNLISTNFCATGLLTTTHNVEVRFHRKGMHWWYVDWTFGHPKRDTMEGIVIRRFYIMRRGSVRCYSASVRLWA